jgi:hypothetical protein
VSEEVVQEHSRPAGDRFDPGKIARLLLTILILVASIMLISGTIATSTTATVNPGGNFTAGALILSNSVEGRAPCLSTAGSVSCNNLFPGVHAPGAPSPSSRASAGSRMLRGHTTAWATSAG